MSLYRDQNAEISLYSITNCQRLLPLIKLTRCHEKQLSSWSSSNLKFLLEILNSEKKRNIIPILLIILYYYAGHKKYCYVRDTSVSEEFCAYCQSLCICLCFCAKRISTGVHYLIIIYYSHITSLCTSLRHKIFKSPRTRI